MPDPQSGFPACLASGSIGVRSVYLNRPAASRHVDGVKTPARLVAATLAALVCMMNLDAPADAASVARPVTRGPGGRILTNFGVWSPDGRWIVYDTRSDPAGEVFDGRRIEMVEVSSGEVRILYTSTRGAHCGVATFHPRAERVVFILGPEQPTADWSYNAWHRQGVVVEVKRPDLPQNLDARDVVPPFTPGALRGGSHVHVWSPAGDWVSFTYEDHVLASSPSGDAPDADLNQRNIGVSVPDQPVQVSRDHPRNHDGAAFSVLVTRTVAMPRSGTDEISRACEEGWVGTNGYVQADGRRQPRAIAFQGHVRTETGESIAEVFIVDLPENLLVPGDGPLAGTSTRRPAPSSGVRQRRLTYTTNRKYPGLQGPRHWLRSSPDGARIAFLAKDDAGVVQLWTISPLGGSPQQLTRNTHDIASAFTWSPDGQWIAHLMDGSVCVTDARTGATERCTESMGLSVRPEACVFSPDGRSIAFVRRMREGTVEANQIWVVNVPERKVRGSE